MRPLTKVLVVACVAVAVGAAPAVRMAAHDDRERAQPQAPPAFRSGVELVEVAVLARDRTGRFVPDLRQDEFQVFEGDAAQTVVAFDRISVPIPSPAAVAATPAVPPDVSTNEHGSQSRVFVIVLDAWHVAAHRSAVVRTLARQFIERSAGAEDLIAVLAPGGLSAATQDFTSDKARALAAIDRFAGSKMRSAAVEIDEEQRALDRGGVAMHGGKDPSDQERSGRAQALTSVLEALARHLGRVERRRKSLLLFSEGIDYNAADVMGKAQRNADDVMRGMTRAVGALMRANVSLYAVDPRALSSAEGDLLEAPLHRAAPSFVTGATPEMEFAASIGTLRGLSDSTGGFAAVNRRDMAGAFERIIDESSNYYLLGYTPARPLKPGEFRQLTVRVSRPGVSVVARRGYAAPAVQQRATQRVPEDVPVPGRAPAPRLPRFMEGPPPEMPRPVSAPGPALSVRTLLASPLPIADLPMRVHAIASAAENGKKATVEVVIEILGRTLEFESRNGRFEERIEIAAETVDSAGKADNGRSTTLSLRLTPEEFQRVTATGVRWLSRLALVPGRHQIRVAAHAARAGKTGLVTTDVDVPRLDPARAAMGGVTMTSTTAVLMITRGEGRSSDASTPPPSAARTFVAGDVVTGRADIQVPAAPGLEIVVTAAIERAGGASTPPARRTITGESRPHTEPIVHTFDTAVLGPGHYVLRFVLDGGGSDGRIERAVPFEIVARP